MYILYIYIHPSYLYFSRHAKGKYIEGNIQYLFRVFLCVCAIIAPHNQWIVALESGDLGLSPDSIFLSSLLTPWPMRIPQCAKSVSFF